MVAGGSRPSTADSALAGNADMLQNLPPVDQLADAARYTPFAQGQYSVRAGLAALGTDFGNGKADSDAFQFDSGFDVFRANKLQARAEQLAKYYARDEAFEEIVPALCHWLAHRLASEHPQHFQLDETGDGRALHCHLTGERLLFDRQHTLDASASTTTVDPPYRDAFDALACQVAEDAAVIVRQPDGTDRAVAIHLCAANHWGARDKIGQSFFAIHQVVPGMEPVNERARQIVSAMIDRGPFVRFVWGVASDTRLNHHPQPPPGVETAQWQGRRFDRDDPQLFVRVERQVLIGLPEVDAALFLIRPSFLDGDRVRADGELNRALQSGLASMTHEQAQYKGVAEIRQDIIDWLAAGLDGD